MEKTIYIRLMSGVGFWVDQQTATSVNIAIAEGKKNIFVEGQTIKEWDIKGVYTEELAMDILAKDRGLLWNGGQHEYYSPKEVMSHSMKKRILTNTRQNETLELPEEETKRL